MSIAVDAIDRDLAGALAGRTGNVFVKISAVRSKNVAYHASGGTVASVAKLGARDGSIVEVIAAAARCPRRRPPSTLATCACSRIDPATAARLPRQARRDRCRPTATDRLLLVEMNVSSR